MKRIFFLMAALFLLVPIFAQANYVVAKGDCLSVIGQKTGVRWQEIAKLNGIQKPWIIHPGQKLKIGKAPVSSMVENGTKQASKQASKKTDQFLYKNPGGDPYTGTAEKAVKLLGYPDEVGTLLVSKVKNDAYGEGEARVGDIFPAMVFGADKVRKNVVCSWSDKGKILVTYVYSVVYQGKEWRLGKVLWCGNFFSISLKDILVDFQEPKVSQPVEPEKPIFLLPEKRECPVEHEPIVGAGIWGNDLAKGRFAYAEYMLWLKEAFGIPCSSEYSIGVGFYANWEDGESKLSDYEWDARGIGPQAGVKRTWWEKKMLRQWQLKARLLWENQDGGNDISGYWMDQDNVKLGLYGEYEHQFDKKWMGILVAEGWWDLSKKRSSSWSGDSPETREMFGIGAYAQYQFNKDWAVRAGGGPFYQAWDELFGIRLSAEARWRDRLMIGPSVAFFPFDLGIYEGIYSASDLTTWTGFVRYEFGPDIREWDRKKRMESIKKMDEEIFGT